MAAAFRPVNTSLAKDAPAEDAMTSNPPSSSSSSHRPSTAPHPQYPQPAEESSTPTRATFAGTVAGQRPLPTSPFPQVPESAEDGLRRDGSQRSAKSPARTSMDVDMDESDGETGTVEENPGSDDESVNADGSKSGKKKKSQRFYCTDYPPCNLSFTRSEHLARHIRHVFPVSPPPLEPTSPESLLFLSLKVPLRAKHTGERPFQCHCSRRFSRLDNLRQHAQTVHVNEDIPIDSLAATGSRFQRQVRNDRVRQAGNRARASTGGSAGGPARGHSKSLSTPSISNIANLAAAASAPYNPQLDPRQRPTPIVMAADPRARLSFESNPGNPENPFSYRQQSPSEFASASGTFPTSQSSPSWRPDLTSPSSSHSRSHSMYSIGSRPASRRLSVPTGPNPFSYAQGPPTGRPPFGPGSISGPSVAAYPKPAASGQTPSPYMSSAEWDARRESSSGANDEAWRRRTWHSDSHGVNGPTVHHPTRPNHPLPIANPSMSSSTLRLPGIESFDPIPRPPASPPRQHLPPLAVDPQLSQRLTPIESAPADERRNLNMYDVSLQRGLNRLDIGRQTPPRELSWNEGSRASQAQPERAHAGAPTVRFEDQPRPSHHMSAPGQSGRPYHQYTMSAPNLVPSREGRRHGYYHGSVSGQQENGQQYAHEPRGPHLEKMVHPNFTGFAGFPARDQPPQHQQQERANGSDPLRRLEALVAVATSEGSTATAY